MKGIILALSLFLFSVFAEAISQDSFTLSSYDFNEPYERYSAVIFRGGVTVLMITNGTAATKSIQIHNTEDTYLKVIALVNHFQFYEFEESYGWLEEGKDENCEVQWSHGKATILTLQLAGTAKSIHYNHGCQGFTREGDLKLLEKRLKETLGLGDYIGT